MHFWRDPRFLKNGGSLEAINHCKFKPKRKASAPRSPGRSLSRSSQGSPTSRSNGCVRGLPPAAVLRRLQAATSSGCPGNSGGRWEVGPRLSGRHYWLAGRQRWCAASVIGGDPNRRGRGRYIRGVSVAAQAVRLLECGAVAEAEKSRRLAG